MAGLPELAGKLRARVDKALLKYLLVSLRIAKDPGFLLGFSANFADVLRTLR